MCKRVFVIMAVLAAVFVASSSRAVVVDGNRIMDQDMCENLCALTFDDGPSNYTPHLLDMLKEEGIPATFFMLGSNARRLPDIVRRIAAEGHEIGNHTFSHPNLLRLGFDQQKAQIAQTEEIFREIGVTSLYMRPPYGNYDDRTIAILKEHGLKLILWSLDSYDWKRLPADYAKLRSTRGTVYEEGNLRGVFLFHDIHKSTVEDFPRIVANLRAGGCQRFVTMSEYLAGVLDDEPCMLMTRRPVTTPSYHAAHEPVAPVTEEAPGDPAETPPGALPVVESGRPDLDNLPLARCSTPYEGPEQLAHINEETLPENSEEEVEDEEMPDALAAARPVG